MIAPEKPPGADDNQIWRRIMNWVRSDASSIKPGDEFTVKQVHAAFPDKKYDTIQKTLQRIVKYEANRIEKTERGGYRRKPAEPDAFKGEI